jgi:hypothetical protein
MSGPTPTPDDDLGWLSLPPMRYPNEYVWFLLVCTMDIALTWVILNVDGTEVNPIAALVIEHWGLPGAVGFKFALTLFVIVSCEIVGRQRDRLGRLLIRFGILVAALPPAYSILLLMAHMPDLLNEVP